MITVTFSLNTFWQPSEAFILEQLRAIIGQRLIIVSVDRALFSGRYVAVCHNPDNLTEQQITALFIGSVNSLGYAGEVNRVERNRDTSTAPGGLPQFVAAGTDTVKETAQAASGVIIPVAIIAVVIATIIYLPKGR